MPKIASLSAKQIEDSRGKPTIEVTLATANGSGVASVPSGASVGTHEAVSIDAKDAVLAVNGEIASALGGKEFDQQTLDTFLCELDGTPNKSRLGANAILGISIAFARAAAAERGVELYAYLGSLAGYSTFGLPCPAFNVINGGKHADNGLAVQEFMLLPVGVGTVKARVEAATLCMDALKQHLQKNNMSTEFGDEGGFAPRLGGAEEALDLLVAAIEEAGYTSEQIKLALDIAASSMPHFDKETMFEWYKVIAKKYPLLSIEDPFTEDDFGAFAALRAVIGETLVVGDDLTVTNAGRIERAAREQAINAVVIKPNQAGTVTEAIAATKAARKLGWKIFASHRSGETLDSFIADFAVGLSCDYIKAGAPTRPERREKYTRLIEIESTLP